MQNGTDVDNLEKASVLTDTTESSGCVCPTQQSCITDGTTSCSPSCYDCLHIESSISMTHSDNISSSSSSRPFYLHPPTSSSSSCGTLPPDYIHRPYSEIYSSSSQQGFFLNPIKTTTVELENHRNQINTTHSWVRIHFISLWHYLGYLTGVDSCSRILASRSISTIPEPLFTIEFATSSRSHCTRGPMLLLLLTLKRLLPIWAPPATALPWWKRAPQRPPLPLRLLLLPPLPPPPHLLPPHHHLLLPHLMKIYLHLPTAMIITTFFNQMINPHLLR